VRVRLAGATDRGRVREHNEDAYRLDAEIGLAVVCDGVGGLSKGDVASTLAADAFLRFARAEVAATLKSAQPNLPGVSSEGKRFVAAVRLANLRTYLVAASDKSCSGMGATLVGLGIDKSGGITIVNVGDSRAYRLRDGSMEQMTTDHTYVNDLVAAGQATRQEADTTGRKSEISRALGIDPAPSVELVTGSAKAGDLYLLCTDGLHGVVSSTRMAELVWELAGDLDRLAGALVDEANAAGGPDNITVALLAVDEAPEPLHSKFVGRDIPDTVEAFQRRKRVIERLYPDPRRSRRRMLVGVLTAAAGAAAVAVVIWLVARPPGYSRPQFVFEPAGIKDRAQVTIDGRVPENPDAERLVRGREYAFVASAPCHRPDSEVVVASESVTLVRFLLVPEADVVVSYPYADSAFRARVVVEHSHGVTDTATLCGARNAVLPVGCGDVSVRVGWNGGYRTWRRTLDRGDRFLIVPSSDYDSVLPNAAGRN